MSFTRKRAAAVAAVTGYLRTEEEALALQSQAAPSAPAVRPATPATPLKVWGLSGRQAQMQIRRMMQLRTFK